MEQEEVMPDLKTSTVMNQLHELVASITSKIPGFRISDNTLNILMALDINILEPSTYKERLKELIEFEAAQYLFGLTLAEDTKNILMERMQNSFESEFDQFAEDIRIKKDSARAFEVQGAQKDTKAKHETHTEIKAETHKISRAVMRNPKPEVRAELNKIHQMLKNEFVGMSDEGLNWLLQGAPAARGGFKDAASLRKFLLSPPESITSSRLITAIDSLTTAIGYRAIGVSWAKPPQVPEKDDPAFEMYKRIQEKFRRQIVPFIAEIYNTRAIDSDTDEDESHVEVFPDDISEASDVDYPEERLPEERLDGQKYIEAIDPSSGKYSWPAAAVRGNVPIRAHVSGSAPIVLSVVNALYEFNQDPWFRTDANVSCFAGAVIIPAYERGDFHSTAETTAAKEYYLEARRGGPVSVKSPQECLRIGLECMASAVHAELEPAIREKSEEILSKTTDENCMRQIGPDEMPGILTNCKNTVLLQNILANQLPKQTMRTVFFWLDSCRDKNAAAMIVRNTTFTIEGSNLSPNGKLELLCILFEKLKHNDSIREEMGFFSLFGRLGNTKTYHQVANEIKEASLRILEKAPPGTFSEQELDEVKQMLRTSTGRVPEVFSAHAAAPQLKAHTEQIQKFNTYKQKHSDTKEEIKAQMAEDVPNTVEHKTPNR